MIDSSGLSSSPPYSLANGNVEGITPSFTRSPELLNTVETFLALLWPGVGALNPVLNVPLKPKLGAAL